LANDCRDIMIVIKTYLQNIYLNNYVLFFPFFKKSIHFPLLGTIIICTQIFNYSFPNLLFVLCRYTYASHSISVLLRQMTHICWSFRLYPHNNRFDLQLVQCWSGWSLNCSFSEYRDRQREFQRESCHISYYRQRLNCATTHSAFNNAFQLKSNI